MVTVNKFSTVTRYLFLTGIFKLHGGEFGKQKLARIDLTKFTNRIMCGGSEAVIKVDIDPFFLGQNNIGNQYYFLISKTKAI